MIDTTAIDQWLEAYRRAWATDSPEDIAALFTPDAEYCTAPHRPPKKGTDEIVTWWVGQGNSTIPWEFTYSILANEGDLYIVQGETSYPEGFEPGQAPVLYDNLWLVTLAKDGRASSFTEYWMLAPVCRRVP